MAGCRISPQEQITGGISLFFWFRRVNIVVICQADDEQKESVMGISIRSSYDKCPSVPFPHPPPSSFILISRFMNYRISTTHSYQTGFSVGVMDDL